VNIRQFVHQCYRSKWGQPARRAEFRVDGLVAEVLKWDRPATGEGVILYTTVGASDYAMEAAHPGHRVEFFLGLLPEKDEIASALAALALYPKRQAAIVDHGHTIPSSEPFWPGTAMRHFVITRSIVPIIEPIEVGNGIHVEFLEVTPIFESELAYKKKHGYEALRDHWKEHGVEFWNPDRLAPLVNTL
jgi:Suppressor of fused protein (SUFU).